MGNPFAKLPPGSPVTKFSLTAWNRMLDMLNWWQSNQAASGGGPLKGLVDWDQTVFRVKNNTGAALDSYAVVGISTPIWTDAAGLPEFLTRTTLLAIAAAQGSPWGIMLEATPAGAIGRCCLVGACPVQLSITAADDQYADLDDSDDLVTNPDHGAKIIWKESGTGAGKWALIVLSDTKATAQFCRFTMTAALTCGGSASANTIVWDGASEHSGGDADPPSETITVWDADSRFSKPATTSGDAGALGVARYSPDRQRWEIVEMQLPGDFFGTLAGALNESTQSVSVSKAILLSGYDPFHGTGTVTAWNPAAGTHPPDYWWDGNTGDAVFCRWDVKSGKYWIVAVEPTTANWQSLDVVTSVSRTTDTITVLIPGGQTNLTYTTAIHYKTQNIKIPPWVTIGDEVTH